MSETETRAETGDLLTSLTQRDALVLLVAFDKRREGKPSTDQDIADRFSDCSVEMAHAILSDASKLGACEQDEDGNWNVTPPAIEVLRVHFRDFDERYEPATTGANQ